VVNWYIFPFWYVWTAKNLATLIPSRTFSSHQIFSFIPQKAIFLFFYLSFFDRITKMRNQTISFIEKNIYFSLNRLVFIVSGALKPAGSRSHQ
jgi:hypothetical protein